MIQETRGDFKCRDETNTFYNTILAAGWPEMKNSRIRQLVGAVALVWLRKKKKTVVKKTMEIF